jgi:hypothetical protein
MRKLWFSLPGVSPNALLFSREKILHRLFKKTFSIKSSIAKFPNLHYDDGTLERANWKDSSQI